MREVFIVSGVRTPIGNFGGGLKDVPAADLGVLAVKETLKRINLEAKKIHELIFGHARQAGNGPNIARQIAFGAGIPQEVPSYTINKACGSGLKAIILGYQEIVLGNAEVIVAGGTENMSRIPFMLDGARWGYRMGNGELVDLMYRDGYFCPLANALMGRTAENLVEKYSISREQQDVFAKQSQDRAIKAIDNGIFEKETVSVKVKDRKGKVTEVKVDEHPRRRVTLDKLAKLPPVFEKGGTVTAGNSSGITDAAASVILMSKEKALELGVKPLLKIIDYAIAGVDPSIMGIAPVPATRKLFKKTGMNMNKIDLIELNEAFAAQVIAVEREIDLDRSKLNVNGGAIALGHPTGATGARIVVTLLHEILRREVNIGLATLCVSGGMGLSMLIERV